MNSTHLITKLWSTFYEFNIKQTKHKSLQVNVCVIEFDFIYAILNMLKFALRKNALTKHVKFS